MLPRAGSLQGLLLLLNSPFCCCWAEQGGGGSRGQQSYVFRGDWLAPGADALGCPDVIGCWSPAPTPIFASAETEGWVSGGKRRTWARRPPQDQCLLQPGRPMRPEGLGCAGANSLRPKEGLRAARDQQQVLLCALSHSVSSLLCQKRKEWEEEMLPLHPRLWVDSHGMGGLSPQSWLPVPFPQGSCHSPVLSLPSHEQKPRGPPVPGTYGQGSVPVKA